MSSVHTGAGRKRDPIWANFDTKKTSKTGIRAVCKKCNAEMQGLVERLKKHVSKCSTSTNPQEGEADKMLEVHESHAATKRKAESEGSEAMQCKIQNKDGNVSKFIVRTSLTQKKEIDLQIARYMYATNSAFRCVENHQFQKLIGLLRPGYTPPSERDLSGPLLDRIHMEEMVKCQKTLERETICLTLDGWSNVHNQPIICACAIKNDGEVYLVDTIDTSGHPHTSDYLEDITKNIITVTQEKFKCRVASFVTDNAANMTKMRQSLFDSSNQNIDVLTYGCSAHLLNLLAKDLNIPSVTENVVKVIKYFRNNHIARAKLAEERSTSGRGLVVPQEVRWNSICDSLQSYIENWPLLVKIVEEHKELSVSDNTIQKLVLNIGLKRNCEDLLKILKPIAIALDETQKNNTKIGDAVFVWKVLQQELEEILELNKFKLLEKRYTYALTPAHFLAYLLYPKYIGKTFPLTNVEKEKALQFAQEKYGGEFSKMVMQFHNQREPFIGQTYNLILAQQKENAMDFWLSMKNITECISDAHMSNITQLLCGACSSAGVERTFSTFGLVHSKLRNRLGVEKAAKLVFLYKLLNKN